MLFDTFLNIFWKIVKNYIDKQKNICYNNEVVKRDGFDIEELCNGSTTDSDSVCWGSNPYSSAKQTTIQEGGRFCFCNQMGFERVGSEWLAGGKSEPTLTESADESDSPTGHQKSQSQRKLWLGFFFWVK